MQRCFIGALAALSLVAGCDQRKEVAAVTSAAPAASAANAAPPVPDVGKVDSVKTTASGLGRSAGEAMAEAMKLALLQVNGAVIDAQSVTARYGLDVSLNQDSASLRANAFAELVRQKSGGVILSLRVVELEEPGANTPGRYKATIEAEIAKFKPSADMQKIKVVVGPITFDQARLPMGDGFVGASEVAAALRQRISDALVQTGRFAVLDRELSPEISRELDMISSGQAPSAELAKLSQAASADLVWSARVGSFAYNRHARQLRSSERELVHYSGGWALSQKLVNVATRQLTASDSLRGTAPQTEPTTLGAGIDGAKVMADMQEAAAGAVVQSLLQRMFPITVVARDGTNVVLSQGGQAVKEGTRYQVVAMGGELKDPQTGQSLGRTETPCCVLVVDRVSANLSYGHLEDVRSNLDGLPVAGLQVRGEAKGPVLAAAAAPAEAVQKVATVKPEAPRARVTAREPAVATVTSESPASATKDDKW